MVRERGQADRGVSRRALLQGGAATAAAALVAHPARALAGEKRPTLLPLSADVWATSVAVSGTPATATLSVNESPVATVPGSGGFSATVPLTPGPNDLTARSAGGLTTSATFNARPADRPTARIEAAALPGRVTFNGVGSIASPYSAAPITGYRWRLRGGAVLGEEATLVLASSQLSSGENYIELTATDASGASDTATCAVLVTAGEATLPAAGWRPEWIESAVLYGVVPWLFGQPALAAVTAALDRLAALGVSALWLSPIFDAAPGDYGYAVTDHFSVRPELGDMESLRALVTASHERGLRVILDMPLNDTSNKHPYFLQALDYKQQSRYWGFYERTAKGAPVTYFNWKDLPNLEYADGEVQRLAIEAALFWLREADVDGFRLDAAWGVQQRAPAFWRTWTSEVLRVKPDALLLAEASALEALWGQQGFSVAYDWGTNIGEWAWSGAFSKHAVATAPLESALAATPLTPPLRFMEDNDTGKRFISSYGLNATRAAAAMLAALPGMPLLFSGQEIGAEYEPYKQQAALDWASDPHGLQAYYTQLLTARRQAGVRTAGALEVLTAQPAGVLAFSSEGRVTAVNFTATEVSARIAAPGGDVTLAVPAWEATTAAL